MCISSSSSRFCKCPNCYNGGGGGHSFFVRESRPRVERARNFIPPAPGIRDSINTMEDVANTVGNMLQVTNDRMNLKVYIEAMEKKLEKMNEDIERKYARYKLESSVEQEFEEFDDWEERDVIGAFNYMEKKSNTRRSINFYISCT